MKVAGDEDKQLKLAIKHAKSLRNRAKRAKNLHEKLEINFDFKQASLVVIKLRRSIFEHEDRLLAVTL
jgi:hypothetical protein